MRNGPALGILSAVIACGGGGYGGSGYSGGGNPADGGATGATITIRAYAFDPANLVVAAGTTITVVNMDSVPHSVTSESAAGQYAPGPVNGVSFDTGAFTGQRTLTIPASAPKGTVVPYYCTVHKSMMAGSGQITVQ